MAPAQRVVWYQWLIGVMGIGIAFAHIPELLHFRMLPVLLFAVMAVLLEAFPVIIRQINVTLTVAVLLAVMVVYGDAAAIWTIAVGSAFAKMMNKHKSSISIEVFNVGQYVLSAMVMILVFHLFYVTPDNVVFGWRLFWAIGIACFTYIIINNLFIDGLRSLRGDFTLLEAITVVTSDGLNSIITLPFALLMIFVSPSFPWLASATMLPIALLAYTMSVHEKTKEIQVIFHSASNLASEFDQKRICNEVTTIAHRLSRADAVIVFLLDRDANCLVPIAVWPNSLENQFLLRSNIPEIEDSFIWGSIRKHSELYIPNTQKGTIENSLHEAELHDYLSVAIYPMFVHSETQGAIVCYGKRSYAFSYVRDYLTILASQASVLLENARLYQELRERSLRDGATGLYNYRYFYEALERKVESALENGEPVSVAILDIDLFKKFNDTYGHLAGDEVLKSIGRLLRDLAGHGAVVARYGGEEFALILPMGATEAYELVETIRNTAARHEVDFQGYKLQGITFSSGIASCPEHTKNDRELILKADSTMYWGAKQRGRNKTALYTPEFDAQLFVDELTGLYTFHFIDIRIREGISQGTGSFGVVCLDLNRFGFINETFGFGMGDKILRQAGMIIRESLRQGELACRYGGDEILVLLPNVNESEVSIIGERLSRAISSYRYHADTNVVVSVKARYAANTYTSVQDAAELFDYIGRMFANLAHPDGSSWMETIS